MIEQIRSGLDILKFITNVREQLKENQRSCRRLCERVEIFADFLSDLDDEESLNKKIQSFNGLERSITVLVKLLSDIQGYLRKHTESTGDSLFKQAHRVVVNVSNRESKALQLSTFNQRINDCVNKLLPGLVVSAERQRQEDSDDLRLHMEEVSAGIVDEILSAQREGNDQVKKVIAELKADCSSQQKEVLQKLRLLEVRAIAGETLSHSDSDIAALTDALSRETETVLIAMRAEFDTVRQSLDEAKTVLGQLRDSLGESEGRIIDGLEERLVSRQALTSREINDLRVSVSADKQDFITVLESKFSDLDMTSVRRDLHTISELLRDLKSVNNSDCNNNHDSSSSGSGATISTGTESGVMIPVKTLTVDEAVQLLIHYGCVDDLHDKVAALRERVDGEYLCGIEDVELLQELEGNNSRLRKPKLKAVFTKVCEAVSVGLSEAVLREIRESLSMRDTAPPPPSVSVQASQAVPVTPPAVPNDDLFKANNSSLRVAVSLWCEDRDSAIRQYGHIAAWDTSDVTDMKELFKGKGQFNEDIRTWDVSKVTSMKGMFWNATSFNQSLSLWKVHNVKDMHSVFLGAAAFNQPLSRWDVSKVKTMNCMFSGALSFNQSLSEWNVSRVTDMGYMFFNAAVFNQPLDTWNICKVKNMKNMFSGTKSFNQTLTGWDLSEVQEK